MSTPAGTLSINSAIGFKPRINVNSAQALAADNVWVEVLVDGSNRLSGPAATPFQLTLSGANAGLFAKGVLTVEDIPAGTTVSVTIRAWDRDTGDTFDTATVRDSTTFSVTLGGALDSRGLPALPSPIVPGFNGLNLGSSIG